VAEIEIVGDLVDLLAARLRGGLTRERGPNRILGSAYPSAKD